MSILNEILNPDSWEEFFEYKIQKTHLSPKDLEYFTDFVKNKRYIEIGNKLVTNDFEFSLPEKCLINKSGSTKKRTIYRFPQEESMVLKFLSFKLYKYDNKMSDNCFSFRKHFGVKRAVDSVISTPNIENMYCYKADISNYFNSINIDKLLPVLQEMIDDKELISFFDKFLNVDKAIFEDNVIAEKRGAMAGTSLSPFFANVYLKDLDFYFAQNNIPYARYSDDIIVFAESKEKLDEYSTFIKNFIREKGLNINPDKESVFAPHTPWNFLGIEYCDKEITLSQVTINKLKAKIRRKAHALHRWKMKKSVTTEKVAKVMIKVYNRKFFEDTHANELTWSRWFFPMITTPKDLHIIDQYLVQYIRFLESGKHCKKNFNFRYKQLKDLGYKSLVNEYYKFKSYEKESR